MTGRIENMERVRLERALAAAQRENEALAAALATATRRADELEAQYAETVFMLRRAETVRDDLMVRCKALDTRLGKLQALLPPKPAPIADVIPFPRRA